MAEAEDTLRAISAGEVDAFVVSGTDGDQRVFTLATADRPYRMFVENMRDGAATLSPSGLILYANRRLAQLLSCPSEAIVGSPLAAFIAGQAPLSAKQLRGPNELGTAFELDLVDADGTEIPVLVGSSPLDVDGERLICLTFTDLSVQKAQEQEIARLGEAQAERVVDLQQAHAALTEQATHDALTNLPNRALLVDRIDQALSQSRRSGRCTAVMFVDLDHFKQVNDTQGHAIGDSVLRAVANKLVAMLRPMDTVARIGGDEFVVLAPDIDGREDAVDMGNRLVTELCSRPGWIADGEPVAASVGIAVAVGGRGTAEKLLHEADTAMYKAKSRGGARAEVFDKTLGRQIKQRAAARQMLQEALDEHRVIAYYQPIVDLPSGAITGFEALARIADPGGSLVPPIAFIPTAEETGLIVPLGLQVLNQACEQTHSWQRMGPAGSRLTVAVNISPRQFDAGDLTTIVRECLEHTHLDPGCLSLELTETAIFDLRPDVLEQLAGLRELGVQIGLDDFGTGYASLVHLRRLPLTFVKVDQSFVRGLGTVAEDEQIVAAVLNLAADLGLWSVAEGIETGDQLQRLRDLGCNQGQGYLFARPLPSADVPAALMVHEPHRVDGM
jgi:diguanylate cyclase (GGDEF)-like protein/PAS domain S-box-containing protein